MTDYTDLKRRLGLKKKCVGFKHEIDEEHGHNVLAAQYGPDPLCTEAAAAIAALEAEAARLKATSPQPAPPADKT